MHLRFLLTNQFNSYITTATSSASITTMIDTAINTVSTNAAGTSPSVLYDVVLSSFASNPLMVGTAWMISSTIFTTYSTTKFIKYKKPISLQDDPTDRQHSFRVQKLTDRLRLWKKRILRYETITKKISRPPWQSNPSHSKTQHHLGNYGSNIRVQQLKQLQSDQAPAAVATRILSPSSVLTMYRFAGSLLFGLLFSTSSSTMSIQQRFYDTIAIIPALLIPSICLFIANFSNTYVASFSESNMWKIPC